MPNWCMNSLKVKGKEAKVKEFADNFEKNGISAFYPTPKELTETDAPAKINDVKKAQENIKKYGYADWYDWRVANWGTKWDVDQAIIISEKDGEVTFGFDTAWAPPIKAFDMIASKNPELRFELEYEEPGMGFFGRAVFEDGMFVADDDYEWDERYDDGWWLYQNMCDLDEELDCILDDLINYFDFPEELTKEIEKTWSKSNESKKLNLIQILDSRDVDYIKKEFKWEK